MNKKAFIDQLARKTGLSKKDARTTLETTLELITQAVQRQEKVTFTGFGTFEARRQKSTQRVNPRTGQRFTVPAKYMPKFRAGKAFKQALSE